MYRRLNSSVCLEDAIANDALYHDLCWGTVKKKTEAPRKTVYTNKEIIHCFRNRAYKSDRIGIK